MTQLSPLRSSQTSPIHPSVLQMNVSLHVVPPALWHVSKLSLPPRQHGGIASTLERFTPECHRHSVVRVFVSFWLVIITCVICTIVQNSFRWCERPHRVWYRRGKNSFSAFCKVPTFVKSHILTRLAPRCSAIAFRHQRKTTFQLTQVWLRVIRRTHTPFTMMTLHSVWMQGNHFIWANSQTQKPSCLTSWLFVVIITSTDQDTIEKWSWSRSRVSSVTLVRRSLDYTIVQLNDKIIAHQMIQDPLTVSHQQREEGCLVENSTKKLHLSDAVRFLSWFEHYFHLDHWMQEFPNVWYCTPGALVHMRLAARVSRLPHCQISLAERDISLAWLRENVPSPSDADLCVEQLDQSIRIEVFCQSTQWRNRQIPWKWHSRNRTRRIQSTLDVGVWKFHSISRRVHTSCHTLRDR